MPALNISKPILKRGQYGRGNFLSVHFDMNNNSGRDYTAVAVRIILRKSATVLVNVVATIYGVPNGRVKTCDKSFPELDFDKTVQSETGIDVQIESAF